LVVVGDEMMENETAESKAIERMNIDNTELNDVLVPSSIA
jgi:hypothetical protein